MVGGEGDDQRLGEWNVVLLLGAIVGCHCSVLWLGGGDDQLWGSGRGAIAGCHCSVLWLGEGDGHLGEWTRCYCRVPL